MSYGHGLPSCVAQVLHQVDELVPANSAGLPYDDLLAVALLLYFGIKTLQVLGLALRSQRLLS